MKIRKITFVILLVGVFVLGGALTFGATQFLGGGKILSGQEYEQFKQMQERYGKLDSLYDKVEENYYVKPDAKDLETGMYKGLLAGLGDPYSGYMTKKEYESWTASTTGEFDGIGITFSANNEGELVIINVIPKTPAERGGMKAGDIILAVDGKAYTDMEAAGAAMRGKSGTKVKVTYDRKGKEKTITLTRAKIINESVTGKIIDGDVAYVKISAFEEHTAEDFEKMLTSLEKKGAKRLVLDLRENGGGLVEPGIEIADTLLGKGTITYLQDRAGNKQTYDSDAAKLNMPYMLLVDGGTASTSEIVAAAVKDEGTDKIVGTKTFGKGVVQSTETLEDGDALKLTIMQYFSPKGNAINKKGVQPDYVVQPGKGEDDKQLNEAIRLLRLLQK